MRRFVITPGAHAQLDAIRRYLDARSEDAWPSVRRKLVAAFRRLAESPNIGHSRPDLTDRPFLFYRVRPTWYLVVYYAAPDSVVIARVYHAGQDLKTNLRKR